MQSSMYGNVDAALRFFMKLVQHMIGDEVGKKQSRADPCVLYLKDENGCPLVVAAVTVDDCLLGGKPSDMNDLIANIEKRFKLTKEDEVKRHLGIDYDWKRDEQREIYLESTMVKKATDIVNTYESYIGKEVKEYDTPGTPGSVLGANDGVIVDLDKYRSLVGKVMFYSTKIGPKQANAVRDLSRHMSNPGEEHWKAMNRVIGYMKGLKLKGMIMTKPVELRIASLTDSDHAKDQIERKSIGGELHTLGGCLTDFSSRGQKSVSLSSTESEYKSLCSASKEMKFQQMLLDEIASVKLPGILLEDNTGAIFLVKNKQVGMRTKHIDVQYHFVREFCNPDLDGIVQGHVEK